MTREQPSGAGILPNEPAFRVALVCMPFYQTAGPSTAVGLLRAIAERAGFATDSYHLNLDLAARLDAFLYNALCRNHHHLVCEWLFAVAAFDGDIEPGEAAYLAACPEVAHFIRKVGRDTDYLSELRHEILPRFIDHCAASIDWGRYSVVGFTSTFQQNVASLALARRIKERWPDVAVVFGGANMEGEAGEEYLSAFPFIDHVVVGDGDIVFPALLNSIASRSQPDGIPGLLSRAPTEVRRCGAAQLFCDLDDLPTPNYDEFFDRARQLNVIQRPDCGWMLPFEASRGCWWGEKHHCTFCGFNKTGMTYRSKSPNRVFEELAELVRRYGVSVFSSTDSIMDVRYVEGLFTRLQETRTDYLFYWESKANLTREQLRTLHRGGVRSLQPGIESLSTHVLRLMRKGSTMLQNLLCLKWSRYYGMSVEWNLLWGFPGEREEDYRRELEVMRLISHLDPPGNCGHVTMVRFSPYFNNRDGFPISGLRPDPCYPYVYPRSVALDRIAFFFDAEFGDTVAPEVHAPTLEWVEEWRQRRASNTPDSLVFRQAPGVLFIDDARGREAPRTHTFGDPAARIYMECGETMRRPGDVVSALASDGHVPALPEDEVQAVLDEFCRLGLMVCDDGWYLGLAIPTNPNW